MSAAEDERRASSCRTKILAMQDCFRKYPREPERGLLCKHLSNAVAVCILTSLCPMEFEAVQSYCNSIGTLTKRRLCEAAQTRLDNCIKSHQEWIPLFCILLSAILLSIHISDLEVKSWSFSFEFSSSSFLIRNLLKGTHRHVLFALTNGYRTRCK